ncbi:extracellular solute-binding protein [Bdellovibrionota bacterium FG-1]
MRFFQWLWNTGVVGGGVLGFGLMVSAGCTSHKDIWIYTSLSKEVIAEMAEPLQASVPEANVKWYQSASENVANRLSTEMESGKVKADLVLTSDPFWFFEMKKRGRLLPYESPSAQTVLPSFQDPEHMFSVVRVPVMVLAYNPKAISASDIPERWKDLTHSRFQAKASMGSPLESVSNFGVVAVLSQLYGWEYFAELRKRDVVAEGSHTSVLTRIETGERPVGVLPLDAVLRAGGQRKVLPIFPADGVIPIPGLIAILRETDHPQTTQKIYDWFFSIQAQSAIVRGGMYSALPKMAAPEGAPAWAQIQAKLSPAALNVLHGMVAGRDQARAKFSEVFLH